MVAEMFRRSARLHGERIAVVEAETGRTRTFAELDADANRVAAALLAAGTTRGERVVYFGLNRIEFFEVYVACAKIGAVVAPLNWTLSDDQVTSLIADLGARTVIVDPEFRDRVPTENLSVRVVGVDYEGWRDAGSADDPEVLVEPVDPVLQPYTSGTTGVPKGVQLTHGNLAAGFESSSVLGYHADSVQLAALPNYHVGGNINPLYALAAGGRMVIVNRFSAETVLDQIATYHITHINMVPAMINLVIEEQVARPRDISSLELIAYGASPVTKRTLDLANQHLEAPMVQIYASTECGCISYLASEDHVGRHLLSVGRPFPGVEISLRDDKTGKEVSAGTRAEICVRSDTCTPGYWNRPEGNSQLFTADGWVRTGDIGYLDEDGFLFLTDRISDMLITGGENVYPAEVEAVLSRYPEVAEVAIVGTPDDKWGELVTACVVPTDSSSFSAEAFQRWSFEQLAGYRRPRRVHVLESLPRNPTGKVLRRELRLMLKDRAEEL